MTNLKTYRHSYAFDKGMNLILRSANSGNRSRMIATTRANRAISHKLYQSLNLTPTEQANLNEALLGKGIFDPHGNQLKTKTGQVLTWDYQNMLQTTTTAQADGSTLAEYNTYAKAGQRNCKVT
ncbi:MAG: hypothetical protein ABJF04_12665, partial [Reichenbachiella sp.]|uniref:hypothetical protein n=1 Tax=Reichenbachiella sp. TaxID=2184521 RepID=UPI003263C511